LKAYKTGVRVPHIYARARLHFGRHGKKGTNRQSIVFTEIPPYPVKKCKKKVKSEKDAMSFVKKKKKLKVSVAARTRFP